MANELGGVFLRVGDPEALYQWYERHFGLVRQHGCLMFPPAESQEFILSFFKRENDYFPTTQPAMLNFRISNLNAFLESLQAAGATIDPKREDSDFGTFAWITDPEGNRVELWEPKP